MVPLFRQRQGRVAEIVYDTGPCRGLSILMVACYLLPAMYLGRVIGTVVAERKTEGLLGRTFLLVQPVDDQQAAVGPLQVAVDTVKAGPKDLVVLVGSREASLALDPAFVPVDAAIVGIVDDLNLSAVPARKAARS